MAKKEDTYAGSIPLKDPQQEFFCELFTTNTLPNYWGNGGNCYALAYGHTERINDLKAAINGTKKMRKGKSKAECEREIEKINNTVRSAASRLLTNVKVKARNGFLMDQLAIDTIVDRELVYLIQQRKDFAMKKAAIEHYDKRSERIRERIDIKHEFDPVQGFNYVMPEGAATGTKKKK